MKVENIKEPQKPPFLQGSVSGIFIPVKQKFNSRSHARQEMQEWIKHGWITNYRIAWNAQLKMTVEVILGDSRCQKHHVVYDYVNGNKVCPLCG